MAIGEGLVDLENTSFDDLDLPTDIENPAALLDHLLIGKVRTTGFSETGVWGDPSDATAELGEEYFDTITHAVAEPINIPRRSGGHLPVPTPRPRTRTVVTGVYLGESCIWETRNHAFSHFLRCPLSPASVHERHAPRRSIRSRRADQPSVRTPLQ